MRAPVLDLERIGTMQRETTRNAAIAEHWIASGRYVHTLAAPGQTSWIKGCQRFTENEQSEAKRKIAAICAAICEAGE
jgi:hypothetical protein